MFSSADCSLRYYSWSTVAAEMTSQSKKLLGQTDARQNLLNIVELFDGKPVIISVVIYSLIELNFTVLPQMFSALHVFYFIIGRYGVTCTTCRYYIHCSHTWYHRCIFLVSWHHQKIVCVCASYWFFIFITKWLIRFVSNKKGLLNKRASSMWWHN